MLYSENTHYLEGLYNDNSSFFERNKKHFTKKDLVIREKYEDLIDFKAVFLNKMKEYKERKIKILFKYDRNFPESITLNKHSLFLYTLGNLDLLKDKNKVAIIGSRETCSKSVKVISSLVRDYVSKNFVVISGLAKGVDTIAHKETLNYSGNTIAIMATSFETVYPKENIDLFDCIICNSGLVLTEYGPFQQTYKSNFLQRNNLVAQMSDEVAVVKASMKSGSLNTVRKASNLNKKVYYFPALIDNKVEDFLIDFGATEYLQRRVDE